MSAPIISWMQKPDLRPSPEQLLSDRIDKIRADFERPRLRVVGCEVIVERDSQYWRRLQHDELNRQRALTCRCCRGTGEMLVYIDEPAEPCAKCQRANPFDTYDLDAPAF